MAFEVRYTREDAPWSEGKTHGPFEDYGSAMTWALRKIVDGWAWKVDLIVKKVPIYE